MMRPIIVIAAVVAASLAAGHASAEQAMPLPKPEMDAAAIQAVSRNAALASALRPALDGDTAAARAAAERLDDPVALSLIEWALIRSGGVSRDHARISEFAAAHPDWPGLALARRRAEQALLRTGAGPDEVFGYFRGRAPASLEGRLVAAEAYLARGDTERAAAFARAVWQTEDLTEAREKTVLARHGDAIRPQDHRLRMLRLIFDGEYASGLRAAQRLGGNDLKVARAMIAAIRGSRDAARLLADVPQAARNHPGYLFARVTHLRREDKTKEAVAAVLATPRDAAFLVDPAAWYYERAVLARRLIDERNYRDAYRVIAGHAGEEADDASEAEFLSGWLALRFLDRADLAEAHFKRMGQIVSMPISLGRAHYWLGRAQEALGHEADARRSYSKAGEHATTFYGQMALAKLGHDTLEVAPRPLPAAVETEAFERNSQVRAIRLLTAAGRDDLTMPFLVSLADSLNSVGEMALLADLADAIGGPRYMLVVGKKALYRGFALDTHAFPTHGIPVFDAVGASVPTALVYAIARQESAFHVSAQSHAGARGLMQLMPATARLTAKRYDLSYNPGALTRDAAYNAQLGSAHLGDLIDLYDGSLILTFAAYNAGPGNVQKWVRRYGDPRTDAIDPLDWMELIPFSETRNYVQRVMENFRVYRARLDDAPTRLDMAQELRRLGAGS